MLMRSSCIRSVWLVAIDLMFKRRVLSRHSCIISHLTVVDKHLNVTIKFVKRGFFIYIMKQEI